MKKVAIITLGCKVNQYESNAIANKLEHNGFEVSQGLCVADIYIINTCAVTNEAEKKSRGIIAKVKKLNPSADLYICGCSSQNNASRFEYENVKAIIGTSQKDKIADLIISNNLNTLFVNTQIDKTYTENYLAKGERTRAVIKIQEGCNNFCSYCLIPYLRGRERSRAFDEVKKEVEFQSKNTNEIVFAGINLSSYGKDLEPKKSLADVAILMREFPNIRFRFSSLEQDIISKEFLEVLSQTPNFAPHFHLSLQSGCDNTLKAMNRKYNSQEYYNKIKLIREYFENPAITTDVIVGFPTETEQDALDTYNFVKKCKFAKMHIFPYSKRDGTLACKLKNVATNVKERATTLGELDKKMQQEYTHLFIGKTLSVLVEREHNGFYEGHSQNFIKCYIKSDKKLKSNQFVDVIVNSIYLDGAICSVK